MNKYVKTFLGLQIVIIPALLAIGWLFNSLSEKSFYPDSGNVTTKGLEQPVKVYLDDYGVPQIFAAGENDAYFTMGYLHARDRLFQMDLSRRVAEGRLSEIFGAGVIDFDKLFRTIGIGRFSYDWYTKVSPKTKQLLDAYSKGVNRFVEDHYRNLPVEFDALNYRPEPWKPEQSLMLARLMAWDLNIAWYTDYILGELVNKVGIEKTSDIFPDTNITIYKKPEPVAEDTTAVDEDGSTEKKPKKKKRTTDETGSIIPLYEPQYLSDVASLGKDFFNTNESYRKFFGINASHTGSNSWVISGDKSAYGKPILANDPHLALQAPSRWYELYLKGGDVDVRGMSFPGVPGIVIGNNRFISWGLTNLMNDDNDFIILNRDSSDYNKYIYNNASFQIDSVKEKIYIKDSIEVEYFVKTTKLGPIISGLNTRGFADFPPNNEDPLQDKLMTFKWTGYEQSDEILCFYNINNAKNWDNFKAALKDFGAPAQNFTYADISGNIGYHAAGKIPIRKTADNNSYLFPTGEPLEWSGFVEFEKLPNTYNPKEGYIITANTNPFEWLKESPEKYYISYLWEPASRYNRIKEVITSKTIFDFDDYRLLQNSYESPYAREVSRYIAGAYDSLNRPNTDNFKWAVERFSYWNGDMLSEESIGALYNVFMVFLVKNTYEDELGADVFNDLLAIQNIPYRSLQLMLKQPENIWWDNTGTPFIEKRDDIIRASLERAIEYLRLKFANPDINTWHWGELHKVKIQHPLGIIEALDKTFNIGPYPIGGDQTSPNNTEYQFKNVLKDNNFNVIVGASMRMIVNMADIDHAYTINSTGQSGQPIHPNYKDQVRMWTFAEYKNNTMNELEMLDKKYKLLMLNP